MMDDDSEGKEIDFLIRRLSEEPRVKPKATPAAGGSDAPEPGEARPVNRWSNARLVMPSAPAGGGGKGFALPTSLPHLPDFSHAFRFTLPTPVMMVRLWVGLGVAHGASMAFWPYPKTYFWGLALYLLAVGLVLVTGVWGARLSWEARLGGAHTIALGTVFGGTALLAAELLRQL